jgi:hypothetical protein
MEKIVKTIKTHNLPSGQNFECDNFNITYRIMTLNEEGDSTCVHFKNIKPIFFYGDKREEFIFNSFKKMVEICMNETRHTNIDIFLQLKNLLEASNNEHTRSN